MTTHRLLTFERPIVREKTKSKAYRWTDVECDTEAMSLGSRRDCATTLADVLDCVIHKYEACRMGLGEGSMCDRTGGFF